MPPALPPLLPDENDSIASTSPGQTAAALPLSDSAMGGDGAAPNNVGQPIDIPDVPDRPERPDLPRIDPEQDFPGGRPERDQSARNRQAIQGLLGAVGAALAPQDSPVAFNVASGLSQGAAQEAQQSEEEFRQRQQAFREFVTDAQRFNRQAKQAEAEQEFKSRMADFEGRMNQRQEAIEGELKRRRQIREQTFERQQNQREHERTLKEIGARGRQDRSTAEFEQQIEEGGASREPRDIEDFMVPQDPKRARDLLYQVTQEIQALESRRGDFVTPELGPRGGRVESVDDEFLDQMSRLRRQKAALEQVAGPVGGPDPQAAVEDVMRGQGSSRAGTGRAQPGGAAAPGRGRPNGGGVRTDQAGPTRQASAALDRYLRTARTQGPKSAIDSLEQDFRRGVLSEQEADLLSRQLVERFKQ